MTSGRTMTFAGAKRASAGLALGQYWNARQVIRCGGGGWCFHHWNRQVGFVFVKVLESTWVLSYRLVAAARAVHDSFQGFKELS